MRKHFTATAYIAAKIDGEIKILLHKHKKLGFWVGIGGHVEKEENPVDTAMREVKEETNLDITCISSTKKPLLRETEVSEIPLPIMLLEERIPAYDSEPPHIHIDNIFAATTKHPENVSMSEEYEWFNNSQITKLTGKTAHQIQEIADRVFTLVKNNL